MWSVIWFLCGCVRVRITAASPQWLLKKLAARRLAFRILGRQDAFTMELLVRLRDLPAVCTAAERHGAELRVLEQCGAPAIFGGLRKRPLLVVLLLAAAVSAVVIPKFVFFYEVSGNETVPSEQILRELRELGVGFGTYGPDIRPQELKNRMLLRIGKLQWLTVQQNGMCARVVVRERPEKEPVADRKTPVNVVASRAGIITEVHAEAGNCLCRVGQAVLPGQLLISAYTDYGYKTKATAALGEIYAETVRRTVCVTPSTVIYKQDMHRTGRRVSLLIGRHRIVLSGAPEPSTNAEKQTKTWYLILPGGFSLPLGIEIERISEYDTREEDLTAEQAAARCRDQAEQAATHDMIAGVILSEQQSIVCSGGVYRRTSALSCREMIARMTAASIRMR